MNKTRRDWCIVYKCCKEKRDSLVAFFSLAATIFSIAIGFYGLVYYVGIKDQKSESLDENEIARRNQAAVQSDSRDLQVPGTSDQSNSKSKQMSINCDDDSDDEILGGNNSNNLQNLDLISLTHELF